MRKTHREVGVGNRNLGLCLKTMKVGKRVNLLAMSSEWIAENSF